MKTTLISTRDVLNVANELELIVTEEMVDEILMIFDFELDEYPPSVTNECVIADLIHEFKANAFIIRLN
jgi:hypothetical protein